MADKVRFEDKRDHRLSISEPTLDDPTLVVCPKCRGMAKIFISEKQPQAGSAVINPAINYAKKFFYIVIPAKVGI